MGLLAPVSAAGGATLPPGFQEEVVLDGLVNPTVVRFSPDGRVFVAGVVELVGMDGFNQVWAAPENLPLKEELTEPARWVTRVLETRPAFPA